MENRDVEIEICPSCGNGEMRSVCEVCHMTGVVPKIANGQVLNDTPGVCRFDYRGLQITIEDHGISTGYFKTQIDEIPIAKPSLSEAQAEIDRVLSKRAKRAVSLPVVGFIEHNKVARLTPTAIIGLNRNTRNRQYADGVNGLEFEIPDTPGNRALILDLIEKDAAYKAVEKQVRARFIENRTRGYGRIDVEDYDEVLRGLEAGYAQALKASEAAQEVISHE